jgi:acyl-CoA synthetase (AMP-forming)/AMP-acid ligase II
MINGKCTMINDQWHNIWSLFEETAKRRARHTALVYLGTRFSYDRLQGLAERFAAGLADLGFQHGERVVLYLPNTTISGTSRTTARRRPLSARTPTSVMSRGSCRRPASKG